MPASLMHTHAQTTLPIIQPSNSWTVAHRAIVLLSASADEAGSAIYRGSDPIFLGSWWKGGKLFPFQNSHLALPSPCSPGAPASLCYINQGLVSPDSLPRSRPCRGSSSSVEHPQTPLGAPQCLPASGFKGMLGQSQRTSAWHKQ